LRGAHRLTAAPGRARHFLPARGDFSPRGRASGAGYKAASGGLGGVHAAHADRDLPRPSRSTSSHWRRRGLSYPTDGYLGRPGTALARRSSRPPTLPRFKNAS